MLRISIICIAIFWSWLGIGQEKTPFATYDFSSDKAYLEKRSALEKESNSIPQYNTLIRLAIEYKDFETYYERWEDEWAKPGNAMVFDFDDEDEWGDYKGGKVASHTWEIGYEEEDDHYAPIINNMLNYLEKNKTYSYKNDDGINVKFEIYNPGTIDMEIYYSADDIEKYKNKFN